MELGELKLTDLWTAGGLLLGFQVSSFSWRVAQEAAVADRADISWIPPADYLNLLAMLTTSFGTFVLPSVGIVPVSAAANILGLATVLLVGHSLSLAGHYELFNRRSTRSYRYFPLQEKIAVGATAVAAATYVALAFSTST